MIRVPWGHFANILPKLGIAKWDFLGALSFEERCNSAHKMGRQLKLVSTSTMLHLNDPPSRYSRRVNDLTKAATSVFLSDGGLHTNIESFDLLAPPYTYIEATKAFVNSCSGAVILDITSMPKRYFFPIVRTLLSAPAVRDLVVTYTFAGRHGEGSLSEDPEPAAALPLFPAPYPDKDPKVLAIGLGLQPLGLPDLLEDYVEVPDLRLLFPFPSDPRSNERTWQFVRIIEESVGPGMLHHDPIFIANDDAVQAFEVMADVSAQGTRAAALAPFGPKPVSLGMCLFACETESPVFYTQPTVYNPDYSIGVSTSKGVPTVRAYVVKQGGRRLFKLGS